MAATQTVRIFAGGGREQLTELPGVFTARQALGQISGRVRRQLEAFNHLALEVGVFGGSGRLGSTQLVTIMNVHEYGARIPVTPRMRDFFLARFGISLRADRRFIIIPERAPLRKTADNKARAIDDVIARGLEGVIAGTRTARSVMRQLGAYMVRQVHRMIMTGLEPPLQLRQGIPLFDTGQLLRHIRYRVETV